MMRATDCQLKITLLAAVHGAGHSHNFGFRDGGERDFGPSLRLSAAQQRNHVSKVMTVAALSALSPVCDR